MQKRLQRIPVELHWVFLLAAVFSLGNLYVAIRVRPEQEKETAEKMRILAKANQFTT